MNTRVRVRKRADVPLTEVWFRLTDKQWALRDTPHMPDPDVVCTRILMGLAPPEETSPGYACIIAEVYDGDPMQRERHKILLDEGHALNPDDFSEANRETYQITKEEYRLPTLYSLQRVAVALKDLYEPDYALGPKDVFFLQRMRTTDGLSYYDPHQEAHWSTWFPLMRPHRPEVTIVGDEERRPEEDREYGRRLSIALFRRDMFRITPNCTLYQTVREDRKPIMRAVGLVLCEMERVDYTFDVRRMEHPDGYQAPTRRQMDEAAERAREMDEMLAAYADAMGGPDLHPDEWDDIIERM